MKHFTPISCINHSRKTLLECLLFIVLVGFGTFSASGQATFALKDHDTVVFYGDSITDQRLYTTLTETFVVTRYPTLDIKFVHSGWGGDTVSGGGGGPVDTRLARDVFAYSPTVVTIMLGMNDGQYQPLTDETFSKYIKGMQHILSSLHLNLPDTRITLIRPSPYDEVTFPVRFPGGYNPVLLKFGDALAEMAPECHCGLADLNAPVVEVLKKAMATDPALAKGILPDQVHPSNAGHLIMAEALLKSWHSSPVVSDVAINADSGKTLRAENATVSNIATGSTLSWTELEGSLPMPVDNSDVTRLVLDSSDFTLALNQENLQVTDLTAPRYQLMIDGQPVGSFNKGELTAGINLATLSTPMSKQAADVHRLTMMHSDIHNFRWRMLQAPPNNLSLTVAPKTFEDIDAAEAQVVVLQRMKAQPKAHTFVLTPAI